MPDLAVTIPFIFDSETAKANAAGGPLGQGIPQKQHRRRRRLEGRSWKPGTETIYTRFDDWKSGPLPKLRRVIARDIPSPSTRRALIERGDADISYGLPPKDFKDLAGGRQDQGRRRPRSPTPSGMWR